MQKIDSQVETHPVWLSRKQLRNIYDRRISSRQINPDSNFTHRRKRQAQQQVELNGLTPILAYRADRCDWQVIAPLHLINATMVRNMGLDSTCSVSVQGFCRVLELTTDLESNRNYQEKRQWQ